MKKQISERIKNIIINSKFLSSYIDEPKLFLPIDIFSEKGCWQEKTISECNEPLIAFNSFDFNTGKIIQLHKRIFAKPAYYEQGIKHAMPIVYARKSVALSLLQYVELLPEEYGIIVYDGYRPIEVQQSLYDTQYEIESKKPENKGLSDIELENLTKTFVSVPSRDGKKPSTHNTGGAMDFSICDINGNELNFGCSFDDFHSVANLAYFEIKLNNNEEITDEELEALLNRRVLCNLAIHRRIGLQPYNGEWWHYDKNNQWDVKLSDAIYGSIDLANLCPTTLTSDIDDLIRRNDSLWCEQKKYLTYQNNPDKQALLKRTR